VNTEPHLQPQHQHQLSFLTIIIMASQQQQQQQQQQQEQQQGQGHQLSQEVATQLSSSFFHCCLALGWNLPTAKLLNFLTKTIPFAIGAPPVSPIHHIQPHQNLISSPLTRCPPKREWKRRVALSSSVRMLSAPGWWMK
jgi:hypothetical protein